ncbi:hypothetical protein SCHPADRAFT_891000 [Schizopora paradoxa]|uniref:Uncharacterized protein n=1 Tax=Schizopora paradoxa TaxID=27342 RepID=A0A0H2RJW8_9AGAM|nr:hypothetical protein SCHPADRAFT_891000 [Schizopora paradoxa]
MSLEMKAIMPVRERWAVLSSRAQVQDLEAFLDPPLHSHESTSSSQDASGCAFWAGRPPGLQSAEDRVAGGADPTWLKVVQSVCESETCEHWVFPFVLHFTIQCSVLSVRMNTSTVVCVKIKSIEADLLSTNTRQLIETLKSPLPSRALHEEISNCCGYVASDDSIRS